MKRYRVSVRPPATDSVHAEFSYKTLTSAVAQSNVLGFVGGGLVVALAYLFQSRFGDGIATAVFMVLLFGWCGLIGPKVCTFILKWARRNPLGTKTNMDIIAEDAARKGKA